MKQLVETIAALPSIEVIRIGSRMPVVWPERVTPELSAFLGEIPGSGSPPISTTPAK
ncbi:MAG: hypothetical protein L6W00_26280 [Lentisphaeria bacterium]|nr:MAG: hypothetical protein L6W00_26280 [Lentisphaeria bacterium]